MDLIKTGKFISEKRKEKKLTQSELAEKLLVSDRAISKWENGVCLPDANNMTDLCQILGITINDLFCGEIVDMKNNEKRFEENLLEMTRLKEERDKQLLNLEIVMGLLLAIFFAALIIIASVIDVEDWVRLAIIFPTLVMFFIGILFLVRIEQTAGYYECEKCHHKYVPTYSNVLWAMHFGRTRYMKCPKCGQKSWQKKVLSK